MAITIVSDGDVRHQAPAGGTFSAGDFLKWSSNTLVVCTDGVQPCGIALNDGSAAEAATGVDSVYVVMPCVVRVTAASGVNFNYGDTCYVSAAQEIDAGTQGNYRCGSVVNTNPATAGEVEMELYCSNTATEGTAHA
jgi:hypothetical protein